MSLSMLSGKIGKSKSGTTWLWFLLKTLESKVKKSFSFIVARSRSRSISEVEIEDLQVSVLAVFFVVTKKALIFSRNFDFAPEYNYFKAYLYFFKCINFILEYNIFLIIMPIFHSHCVPFRLRSVRYLNLSGLLRAV